MIDEFIFRRTKGKVARLSYPPRSITVTITGACLFKCKFCVNHCPDSRDNKNSAKLYKIPFHLSLEQFTKTVDWAYKGRIPHFHICAAGEPFLHGEMVQMIDYVIEKYGHVSFQTDFVEKIFKNRENLDKILQRKDRIDYITTDILSGDKRIHEDMKAGSDLDKLIDCMRYISARSEIVFDVHHILTHKNYKDLYKLPEMLKTNNINFRLNIVNLHPYNFNELTSMENVYTSKDYIIAEELNKVVQYCKENNKQCTIPAAFDQPLNGCGVFWSRIQLIPVKSLPKDKWLGNAIPGYCNAVVNGDLITIGNIFEYDNVMDFWNNPQLISIRENLLNEIYPDAYCRHCQNYLTHRGNKSA